MTDQANVDHGLFNLASAARLATPRRLLARPTFILSTVRSGSTLLRCLLNSHSRLCAPSELHLRSIGVHLDGRFAELAMATQDLVARDLDDMLWDRLLAHLLERSGKSFFVDKTPSNIKIWDRLIECWPDARFIVLRRNPAAIVASIVNNGHERQRAITVAEEAVCDLDRAINGIADLHVVSYESLTADTEDCLRGICEYLRVEFEPQMIEYGCHSHGPFVYGIGDWSERIRSGKVELPRPVPVPSEPGLLEMCQRWGYFLDSADTTDPACLGDHRQRTAGE